MTDFETIRVSAERLEVPPVLLGNLCRAGWLPCGKVYGIPGARGGGKHGFWVLPVGWEPEVGLFEKWQKWCSQKKSVAGQMTHKDE